MFYAPSKIGLMKKNKEGVYNASNVWFDPKELKAYSFKWWRFVDKINGKIVFNNYSYSSFTSRHQSKVRNVMRELGIKIDLEFNAPKGLQDLDKAIEHYEYQVKKLTAAIEAPRSHKAKNEQRVSEIRSHLETIKTIKKLRGVK